MVDTCGDKLIVKRYYVTSILGQGVYVKFEFENCLLTVFST